MRPLKTPSAPPRRILVLASILVLAATAVPAQERTPTMEEAAGLFAFQDWPAAARAYEAITAAEPDNAQAWFAFGRALFQSYQVDRAREAFEKSLELGAPPARTMLHVARCHSVKGEDAQALEWIEKAVATGSEIYKALTSTQEFERLSENASFREIVDRLRPCNTPAHRLLDFWMGSWGVVTGEEQQQVGTNSIQKILNGCAVIENWKSVTGSEGKSLFYFHDDEQTWKQVWITDGQRLKEKRLIAVLDGGALRFLGEIRPPGGGVILDRTTLTPIEENKVRQVIEQSIDGGETWQVGFDAFYVRD